MRFRNQNYVYYDRWHPALLIFETHCAPPAQHKLRELIALSVAHEFVVYDHRLLGPCQTRQEEYVCLIRLYPVHLVNLGAFCPPVVQVKLVEFLSITVIFHHADVLDLQDAVQVDQRQEVRPAHPGQGDRTLDRLIERDKLLQSKRALLGRTAPTHQVVLM